MEREQIITKVKLRCDELGPFEEGQVIDSGQIDHLLDDSVKRLLLIVPPYIPTPVSFIDGEYSTGGAVPYADDLTGYVPLPEGFVRLVSLKMANWQRAVTRAITENDPLYAKQGNPYLRGSHTKPVVVYRYEPGVGKVLEYYSVELGEHDIDKGLCLIAVAAENLEDDLVDPLAWLVAATILDTRGEFDAAKAANQKLAEWINSKSVI